MAEPQHWYTVREERAKEFEARGFKIKLDRNDKWRVRCGRSDLTEAERSVKGMVADVQAIVYERPRDMDP